MSTSSSTKTRTNVAGVPASSQRRTPRWGYRRRRSTSTSATVEPSASSDLAPSQRQAIDAGMRTWTLISRLVVVPRLVVLTDPVVHVARHVVLVVVVRVHVLELDHVVALHRGVVHRVPAVLVQAVLDVPLGRFDRPRLVHEPVVLADLLQRGGVVGGVVHAGARPAALAEEHAFLVVAEVDDGIDELVDRAPPRSGHAVALEDTGEALGEAAAVGQLVEREAEPLADLRQGTEHQVLGEAAEDIGADTERLG